MDIKWVYPENKEISQELVQVCGSKIIAQILANRGITEPEKAKDFLHLDDYKLSDPYLFEDMEKAVERIKKAIETQEKVFIYGDFDCDGVTSTSLLYKTLKHIGVNVEYYIPNRNTENHGLNSKAILNLISKQQAKLIITVDCGIGNTKEVKLAQSFKCDVIITDHHEGQETLPEAYAIIDPKTMEGDLDIKNLAGVGVAFKLACALLKALNQEDFINQIFYLVSIGTIADVVPLVGENRALVHQGLKTLSDVKPIGLTKLLEVSNNGILNVNSETIAFGVAPRINAVGRLESAKEAVKLLTTDEESTASTLANNLDYCNKKRQEICECTFVEAENKIAQEINLEEDKAIILMEKDWHAGIIGIVASKLVEKYYKPAFLMCFDEENNVARCSARSIKGVHLFDTISNFEEYFMQFGGHELAAGFSLDLSKIKFKDFKDKLNEYIKENTKEDAVDAVLKIDMSIKSTELNVELVNEIEKLAPFGEKNPSPLFSINDITLNQYKLIGSNNNHLKLFLTDDDCNSFEALWWQKDSIDANNSDKVDLAFAPSINSYNNIEKVQLIVKDLKISENNNTKKNIPSVCDLEKIKDDSLKWIDLRNKPHIEDFLNTFIKNNTKDAGIFVEHPKTIEYIEKFPFLKQNSFDRNNLKESKNIFLLDIPSDFNVLSNIIKQTNPQTLYIMDKNNHPVFPLDVIKRLAGMLKYVYNNKKGQVEINILASKLSISESLTIKALKTLNESNVIKVLEKPEKIISFEFKNSVNFKELENQKTFNEFKYSISKEEDFKNFIVNNDIEEIKNFEKIFTKNLVTI